MLALSLVLWTGSGCAGYRLGPSNGMEAGDKSVQIRPFTNKTIEPRLSDALVTELRREIQRDGTFHLARQDEADIIVSGVITRYTRHELSLSPADTLTVRDYRLSLTAQVTARERTSGKVLLQDQVVTGYTVIRDDGARFFLKDGSLAGAGSDLTSTERQSLPLLADDLAKNITALLADGSW